MFKFSGCVLLTRLPTVYLHAALHGGIPPMYPLIDRATVTNSMADLVAQVSIGLNPVQTPPRLTNFRQLIFIKSQEM